MTAARAAMPIVAAWIDALREAFGREAIDGQIRKATAEGLPTFYAEEAGHRVGVPLPEAGRWVGLAEMVVIPPEEKEPHADRNRRR